MRPTGIRWKTLVVTRRGLPLVKLKGLVALPDHLVPLVVALASWLACDQTQTLHSQPFRRHRHRSSPRRRSQWRQHRPGLKQ